MEGVYGPSGPSYVPPYSAGAPTPAPPLPDPSKTPAGYAGTALQQWQAYAAWLEQQTPPSPDDINALAQNIENVMNAGSNPINIGYDSIGNPRAATLPTDSFYSDLTNNGWPLQDHTQNQTAPQTYPSMYAATIINKLYDSAMTYLANPSGEDLNSCGLAQNTYNAQWVMANIQQKEDPSQALSQIGSNLWNDFSNNNFKDFQQQWGAIQPLLGSVFTNSPIGNPYYSNSAFQYNLEDVAGGKSFPSTPGDIDDFKSSMLYIFGPQTQGGAWPPAFLQTSNLLGEPPGGPSPFVSWSTLGNDINLWVQSLQPSDPEYKIAKDVQDIYNSIPSGGIPSGGGSDNQNWATFQLYIKTAIGYATSDISNQPEQTQFTSPLAADLANLFHGSDQTQYGAAVAITDLSKLAGMGTLNELYRFPKNVPTSPFSTSSYLYYMLESMQGMLNNPSSLLGIKLPGQGNQDLTAIIAGLETKMKTYMTDPSKEPTDTSSWKTGDANYADQMEKDVNQMGTSWLDPNNTNPAAAGWRDLVSAPGLKWVDNLFSSLFGLPPGT